MRKWMAFVMLALIFSSQVGYYGLFTVEQELIRYEQKRKLLGSLPDEALARIPYDPSMTFMDDDQEFSLNGEQYDIVRSSVEKGIKVYYAVNDKDETKLLKRLAETGKNHSQQNGEKRGLLKISVIYFSSNAEPEGIHMPLIQTMHPVIPVHRGTDYTKETTHPPDFS